MKGLRRRLSVLLTLSMIITHLQPAVFPVREFFASTLASPSNATRAESVEGGNTAAGSTAAKTAEAGTAGLASPSNASPQSGGSGAGTAGTGGSGGSSSSASGGSAGTGGSLQDGLLSNAEVEKLIGDMIDEDDMLLDGEVIFDAEAFATNSDARKLQVETLQLKNALLTLPEEEEPSFGQPVTVTFTDEAKSLPEDVRARYYIISQQILYVNDPDRAAELMKEFADLETAQYELVRAGKGSGEEIKAVQEQETAVWNDLTKISLSQTALKELIPPEGGVIATGFTMTPGGEDYLRIGSGESRSASFNAGYNSGNGLISAELYGSITAEGVTWYPVLYGFCAVIPDMDGPIEYTRGRIGMSSNALMGPQGEDRFVIGQRGPTRWQGFYLVMDEPENTEYGISLTAEVCSVKVGTVIDESLGISGSSARTVKVYSDEAMKKPVSFRNVSVMNDYGKEFGSGGDTRSAGSGTSSVSYYVPEGGYVAVTMKKTTDQGEKLALRALEQGLSVNETEEELTVVLGPVSMGDDERTITLEAEVPEVGRELSVRFVNGSGVPAAIAQYFYGRSWCFSTGTRSYPTWFLADEAYLEELSEAAAALHASQLAESGEAAAETRFAKAFTDAVYTESDGRFYGYDTWEFGLTSLENALELQVPGSVKLGGRTFVPVFLSVAGLSFCGSSMGNALYDVRLEESGDWSASKGSEKGSTQLLFGRIDDAGRQPAVQINYSIGDYTWLTVKTRLGQDTNALNGLDRSVQVYTGADLASPAPFVAAGYGTVQQGSVDTRIFMSPYSANDGDGSDLLLLVPKGATVRVTQQTMNGQPDPVSFGVKETDPAISVKTDTAEHVQYIDYGPVSGKLHTLTMLSEMQNVTMGPDMRITFREKSGRLQDDITLYVNNWQRSYSPGQIVYTADPEAVIAHFKKRMDYLAQYDRYGSDSASARQWGNSYYNTMSAWYEELKPLIYNPVTCDTGFALQIGSGGSASCTVPQYVQVGSSVYYPVYLSPVRISTQGSSSSYYDSYLNSAFRRLWQVTAESTAAEFQEVGDESLTADYSGVRGLAGTFQKDQSEVVIDLAVSLNIISVETRFEGQNIVNDDRHTWTKRVVQILDPVTEDVVMGMELTRYGSLYGHSGIDTYYSDNRPDVDNLYKQEPNKTWYLLPEAAKLFVAQENRFWAYISGTSEYNLHYVPQESCWGTEMGNTYLQTNPDSYFNSNYDTLKTVVITRDTETRSITLVTEKGLEFGDNMELVLRDVSRPLPEVEFASYGTVQISSLIDYSRPNTGWSETNRPIVYTSDPEALLAFINRVGTREMTYAERREFMNLTVADSVAGGSVYWSTGRNQETVVTLPQTIKVGDVVYRPVYAGNFYLQPYGGGSVPKQFMNLTIQTEEQADAWRFITPADGGMYSSGIYSVLDNTKDRLTVDVEYTLEGMPLVVSTRLAQSKVSGNGYLKRKVQVFKDEAMTQPAKFWAYSGYSNNWSDEDNAEGLIRYSQNSTNAWNEFTWDEVYLIPENSYVKVTQYGELQSQEWQGSGYVYTTIENAIPDLHKEESWVSITPDDPAAAAGEWTASGGPTSIEAGRDTITFVSDEETMHLTVTNGSSPLAPEAVLGLSGGIPFGGGSYYYGYSGGFMGEVIYLPRDGSETGSVFGALSSYIDVMSQQNNWDQRYNLQRDLSGFLNAHNAIPVEAADMVWDLRDSGQTAAATIPKKYVRNGIEMVPYYLAEFTLLEFQAGTLRNQYGYMGEGGNEEIRTSRSHTTEFYKVVVQKNDRTYTASDGFGSGRPMVAAYPHGGASTLVLVPLDTTKESEEVTVLCAPNLLAVNTIFPDETRGGFLGGRRTVEFLGSQYDQSTGRSEEVSVYGREIGGAYQTRFETQVLPPAEQAELDGVRNSLNYATMDYLKQVRNLLGNRKLYLVPEGAAVRASQATGLANDPVRQTIGFEETDWYAPADDDIYGGTFRDLLTVGSTTSVKAEGPNHSLTFTVTYGEPEEKEWRLQSVWIESLTQNENPADRDQETVDLILRGELSMPFVPESWNTYGHLAASVKAAESGETAGGGETAADAGIFPAVFEEDRQTFTIAMTGIPAVSEIRLQGEYFYTKGTVDPAALQRLKTQNEASGRKLLKSGSVLRLASATEEGTAAGSGGEQLLRAGGDTGDGAESGEEETENLRTTELQYFDLGPVIFRLNRLDLSKEWLLENEKSTASGDQVTVSLKGLLAWNNEEELVYLESRVLEEGNSWSDSFTGLPDVWRWDASPAEEGAGEQESEGGAAGGQTEKSADSGAAGGIYTPVSYELKETRAVLDLSSSSGRKLVTGLVSRIGGFSDGKAFTGTAEHWVIDPDTAMDEDGELPEGGDYIIKLGFDSVLSASADGAVSAAVYDPSDLQQHWELVEKQIGDYPPFRILKAEGGYLAFSDQGELTLTEDPDDLRIAVYSQGLIRTRPITAEDLENLTVREQIRLIQTRDGMLLVNSGRLLTPGTNDTPPVYEDSSAGVYMVSSFSSSVPTCVTIVKVKKVTTEYQVNAQESVITNSMEPMEGEFELSITKELKKAEAPEEAYTGSGSFYIMLYREAESRNEPGAVADPLDSARLLVPVTVDESGAAAPRELVFDGHTAVTVGVKGLEVLYESSQAIPLTFFSEEEEEDGADREKAAGTESGTAETGGTSDDGENQGAKAGGSSAVTVTMNYSGYQASVRFLSGGTAEVISQGSMEERETSYEVQLKPYYIRETDSTGTPILKGFLPDTTSFEARYQEDEGSFVFRPDQEETGSVTLQNLMKDPEKTRVEVLKVWDDQNNADGSRPGQIMLSLLADGEPAEEYLVLGAAERWQGSFENLPKYRLTEEGELAEIAYTVEETTVPSGYTVRYGAPAVSENGVNLTVTNSHTPEPEPDPTPEPDPPAEEPPTAPEPDPPAEEPPTAPEPTAPAEEPTTAPEPTTPAEIPTTAAPEETTPPAAAETSRRSSGGRSSSGGSGSRVVRSGSPVGTGIRNSHGEVLGAERVPASEVLGAGRLPKTNEEASRQRALWLLLLLLLTIVAAGVAVLKERGEAEE